MCYRRNPSLRNKLAKTRYIQELATPTNRHTLKPHCANRCWNRKCPTCPDIQTSHQFLRTTLATTHTTKCNYLCRSNGIVYLVTFKRCHKQYLGLLCLLACLLARLVRLVNFLVKRPTNQPTDQPTNRPTDQPTKHQPTKQLT